MATKLSELVPSAEAIERGFGGASSKTPRTSRFLDNFGFGEVARVSLLLFLLHLLLHFPLPLRISLRCQLPSLSSLSIHLVSSAC